MSKLPLVIYHADCFDGFTSAWVFRKLRGDAEFFPARYGEAPPDCTGREVWVLDFSYPRPEMKRVVLQSRTTTICDHHITAQTSLEGLLDEIRHVDRAQRGHDRIVFDMNRSGAGITYDVLMEGVDKKRGYRLPGGRKLWLVDYVEDRDLWKFMLPESRAVAAWLAAQPFSFEAWDRISAETPSAAAGMGRAVLQYISYYGEKARAHARAEKIGGHLVPTMNIPYQNCSEHLEQLLMAQLDVPFVASYFRRGDGTWQFSLRSSGFDVSEVAKTYGGGGHKQAAGFECSVLPWEPNRFLTPEQHKLLGIMEASEETAEKIERATSIIAPEQETETITVSGQQAEAEEWLGGDI